ncbi:molybdenum ABC transporter ATP-binding protein [Brachybacterium avium]|uniref:Molybdenum ABC transporter ATP-binding protein n=1 Tax=Brachybacterium avium TaxID=2017485 RepID=A0A220U9D6_9MICO|nr:ABC transporter ATP-binding protein [Brachybacterium avium]ASK64728.1 molybdenum ABC transporter ATP-binding protein [Brachybacterium avium]
MSLQLRARVPERDVELDLAVAAGQTLALIGPNGAGKSTVLALVAGTLRTPRGRVELEGRVLAGERSWTPPHHRRVTTLSQDPVLFPHLTARGNVMFPLRSQGMPRARARAEAERWLTELGLQELAERRPAMLSGGQAQRVAIARALAADPRLLLLDEPMAALDIDVASALREQLRRFLTDRTAIIVTHDVLDALTLADRLAVLEEGRVIEQGPTRELLTRPRTSFTARFAGLNLVTGRWEDGAVVLADGARLPAPGPHPAGRRVHAAFRPSAVRPASQGGIRRTVTGLFPHGDLVRVRTEDLAADLPPQEIAELRLEPGAAVHLAVSGDAVTTYEA